MAAKKELIERSGVSHDKCEAVRRVVLVGTYKGDQLTKWRGWYNYPVTNEDIVEQLEMLVNGKRLKDISDLPLDLSC